MSNYGVFFFFFFENLRLRISLFLLPLMDIDSLLVTYSECSSFAPGRSSPTTRPLSLVRNPRGELPVVPPPDDGSARVGGCERMNSLSQGGAA